MQVNEETGNRRPVMLSVLTRSEKESQAAAANDQQAADAVTDMNGEAKQSFKGINSMTTEHSDAGEKEVMTVTSG